MDPDKRVLVREDQPIPLTPKVFETLLLLVQRNREVVSKEELLNAIWPDSFVEESNLTQNIFVLRKALGDTQDDRRYILTVPGRGYRFAIPVLTVPEHPETFVAQMRSRTQIVIEEHRPDPPPTSPALALPKQSKFTRKAFAAVFAAAALIAIAMVLLLRHREPPPVGQKNSVLIAQFSNSTADPIFDNALRQGLEIQLEQSPFLTVVSENRIQQALRLMEKKSDTPIAGQLAREICLRTEASAMLEGSIQSVGGQYLLTLRATRCSTGDLIDEQQAQVPGKENVLSALSSMSRRVRERVGETRATLDNHDVPIAQATTSSLEALEAYSLGLQADAKKGDEAAIPFFKHAVALDPKFAMAYAYLALMYGSSGSSELSAENIRKAYELRDGVSDNEQFFISAYYFGRGTGNQEKARQVCESWIETYPRDPLPHGFLSGFIYRVLANYDKAIDEGRKLVEMGPDYSFAYDQLAVNFLHTGHPEKTEETLRAASEHKVESPHFLLLKFDIAFSKNDRPAMQQVISAGQGKSDSMDWLVDRQAFALAYSGQLRESRSLSQQAVDLTMQAGNRERAAVFRTRAALWQAFLGNPVLAKQDAATALATARNREVEYGTAVAFALAGDLKSSQALADDLDRKYPEDTSVRFNYLPVIRAALAIRRNEPLKAIELLNSSTPYELGVPRSAITWYFGAMYPIFIRGDAYLAERRGSEAVREFQKMLAHPGLILADPLLVLAHLRLAQAYAMSGDAANACTEYKSFLNFWKNADPDLPIYKQAQAEYAALQ